MIRLKKLRKATKNYLKWMNDAEVVRFIKNPHKNESDLQKYIAQSFGLFGIYLKDEHIGNVGLTPGANGGVYIGILIGEKQLWGCGYGSQALEMISDHAFYELGFRNLMAGCNIENIRSINLFIKNGFLVERVKTDPPVLLFYKTKCKGVRILFQTSETV